MPRVFSLSLPTLSALVGGAVLVAAGPASAQVCQEGAKLIQERQTIIQQLNKAGGKDKKLDPRMACGAFGKLVSNGSAAIKWMDTNKDWCSIPDPFVENFKGDHAKATELRGKACAAAAQVQAMEKKARQAQQEGGPGGGGPGGGGPGAGGAGGMLGGPGLTGSFKLPQGAL